MLSINKLHIMMSENMFISLARQQTPHPGGNNKTSDEWLKTNPSTWQSTHLIWANTYHNSVRCCARYSYLMAFNLPKNSVGSLLLVPFTDEANTPEKYSDLVAQSLSGGLWK